MPSFATPEAITATIGIEVGSIRITAGKREDTVVEVTPGRPGSDADVRAAEATEVSFSGDALTVRGPSKRVLFGRAPSVQVVVELPAGSHVEAVTAVGDILAAGPLGDCRLRTASGDLRVEAAHHVNLRNEHGEIRVGEVAGDADITGSGRTEVVSIAGRALVGNGNGETLLGEVLGELRAKSSNGPITVGTAGAGVEARSSNGAIRIGQVARGRVVLETGVGEVEVGIRQATAAWLDVHTDFGALHNTLGQTAGPAATDETAEIRVRSGYGDIVIRRA
ncbi:DUF4097 domain-containing protein [Streptomyces sp. NPDC048603]|uniref:DUF4097 family beta strand repeat-containing protein n=1 Tax=Streptomyces sp. NPDC048603 TaxID=3365577 RepID=UPI003715D65F